MSRCHRERGDQSMGIQVGERALDQLTESGGQWSDSMVMLGATILAAYYTRGDLAYANQFAEALIDRAEAIGSPRSLMATYWNAAFVAESRGDFDGAQKQTKRANTHQSKEDDPRYLSRLRTAYALFL